MARAAGHLHTGKYCGIGPYIVYDLQSDLSLGSRQSVYVFHLKDCRLSRIDYCTEVTMSYSDSSLAGHDYTRAVWDTVR